MTDADTDAELTQEERSDLETRMAEIKDELEVELTELYEELTGLANLADEMSGSAPNPHGDEDPTQEGILRFADEMARLQRKYHTVDAHRQNIRSLVREWKQISADLELDEERKEA